MQNETKRFSIGVDLMAERFAAFKFQEIPEHTKHRKKYILFFFSLFGSKISIRLVV